MITKLIKIVIVITGGGGGGQDNDDTQQLSMERWSARIEVRDKI